MSSYRTSQPEDGKAYEARADDEDGLGDLEAPQEYERRDGKPGRRNIEDRALAQHEAGARDRARRRGRDALDEGLDLRIGAPLVEPGIRDDDEEIDGQEDADTGRDGPAQPRHEIADEGD